MNLLNPDNPVVRLCVAGTRAEFNGELDRAARLYRQAWVAAQDDLEACIAAHYVARFQRDPQEALRWNRRALEHAEHLPEGSARSFYPSLYLSLGRSYDLLGQPEEARRWYALAENALA